MTDNELLVKIKEGELSAFQELYLQYYVPLCVYAKQYTKTKEVAEEVVQDLFLHIWEQKGQLRITVSLKAYLFTAIRNQCLNHLKHLQVVNGYSEYYTQLLNNAQDYYTLSQETGDSILIANELEKSLNEAIDSLPEHCRKIFIMSRFEGIKHQDIADKLGITLHTVHKQISIALDKLRTALKIYLSTLPFAFLLSRFF
jgi:RNA polymerase sigma-70 factor (family 1)